MISYAHTFESFVLSLFQCQHIDILYITKWKRNVRKSKIFMDAINEVVLNEPKYQTLYS